MSNLVELSPQEQKLAERVTPESGRAVALRESTGAVTFANMSEVMEFAKMMAVSSHAVPKHLRGNPGACLAVVVQATEWGMSPYSVARKSYNVNDVLSYEAQLIAAVILRRAPIKGRFGISYDGSIDDGTRTCTVKATLSDGTGVVEYTSPPIAKISPKNSPLWKTDADQQLAYYSERAICRRHFPDVLLGIYDREEIEALGRGEDDRPARVINPLDDDIQGDYVDVNTDAYRDPFPLPAGWSASEDGAFITVPDGPLPQTPEARNAIEFARVVTTVSGKVLKSADEVQGDPVGKTHTGDLAETVGVGEAVTADGPQGGGAPAEAGEPAPAPDAPSEAKEGAAEPSPAGGAIRTAAEEKAFQEGAAAAQRGRSRKVVPGKYVDVPALKAAWLAGHDSVKGA